MTSAWARRIAGKPSGSDAAAASALARFSTVRRSRCTLTLLLFPTVMVVSSLFGLLPGPMEPGSARALSKDEGHVLAVGPLDGRCSRYLRLNPLRIQSMLFMSSGGLIST